MAYDPEMGNSPNSRLRRKKGIGGWGRGRATWTGQLARDSGNYGIMKRLTRELLQERQEQVRENPSAKETDRLTLSTIFYRVRKKLYTLGVFDGEDRLPKSTRKTIQNDYIKDICENELGVKRAELGIYAAVRAQLYWDNEAHDVNLKTIDALLEHGTDVLIIEKEGIADVLAPFAAKVGIAILNPRGFLTESADDYSQLVLEKLKGNNVATLNDFDASGVCIAKKANGIISIGVDLQMVEDLGLELSQVEEAYNGSSNDHYKWLKAHYPKYEHLDYLASKRVEIDSINSEVGAQKLWEAVLKRLEETFPNRDYTRVICTDAIFVTGRASELLFDYDSTVVNKLNTFMENKTEEIAEDKKSQFTQELEDYEGIHEVETLASQNGEEFNEACRDANPEASDIPKACSPLLRELEKKIEERTAEQRQEIEDIEAQIQELQDEIEAEEDEINDIAEEETEAAERDKIIPAIQQLDDDKGYDIVETAKLLEEEEYNESEE